MDECARCGYPKSEHSYNGACYGLCGDFIMKNGDAPEYNENLMCPNCGEKSEVYTGLYGLLGGGGVGRYTMCADCGTVVSKTCDSHEPDDIIDAEFTEVNDAEKLAKD